VAEPLRLMCVLAHPDDESLATGGTLAKYARRGVETYVVLATRGEHGRCGTAGERPSAEALGRIREHEAREAAAVLGVRELCFLDCQDGGVDRVVPTSVIARIADELRRVRPQVVITLPPDGGYGHPDHIGVCQFTTAAVLYAADAAHAAVGAQPYVVSKLYYVAWTDAVWKAYQALFSPLRFVVDSVERCPVPWPDWAVTTMIDARECSDTVWRAVRCHQTQTVRSSASDQSGVHRYRSLFGYERFYRAISLVNGGRQTETDLFEGIG
jgi:LmbE family N-acetylglucosaminyl deacetylase